MLTTVGKARVGNCIVRHKPAATASEGAKALRFPGMCCLKAVVVRLDGWYAMCAVPCTRCVDLTRLAALASVTEARLATASELRERVPAAQVRPSVCLLSCHMTHVSMPATREATTNLNAHARCLPVFGSASGHAAVHGGSAYAARPAAAVRQPFRHAHLHRRRQHPGSCLWSGGRGLQRWCGVVAMVGPLHEHRKARDTPLRISAMRQIAHVLPARGEALPRRPTTDSGLMQAQ